MSDSDPHSAEEYYYDAYGKTVKSASIKTGNPFAYTGREMDDEDLYYYRARYYDPTIGRFLSEDPIGFASGDFNFYRYVLNNPMNYVDPYGYGFWNYVSKKVAFGAGVALTAVTGVAVAVGAGAVIVTVGAVGAVGLAGYAVGSFVWENATKRIKRKLTKDEAMCDALVVGDLAKDTERKIKEHRRLREEALNETREAIGEVKELPGTSMGMPPATSIGDQIVDWIKALFT